jgi:hypothetical protein
MPSPRLALIAAALLPAIASTASATPCAVDSTHLGRAQAHAPQRQPLLRPFVIGGMAATAVRQHEGQRWIELAVDSVGTAGRALGAPASLLRTTPEGAVLLACSALEVRQVAAAPAVRSLSAPLW